MSAYIVERGHIAYLVQAGRRWSTGHSPLRWGRNLQFGIEGSAGSAAPGNQRNAVEVGQMLWDENVRSVQSRYGKENAPGPRGETYFYSLHVVVPEVTLHTDPVQVIKACDCFAYQSCETDDWKSSEAYYYIEALKDAALPPLAGYEDAVWGAPKAWLECCRLPLTDTEGVL